MEAPRIFSSRRLLDAAFTPLENLDVDWKVRQGDDDIPRQELIEQVSGCTALIVFHSDQVNDELLDTAGPGLCVVANYGVGYDHIDVDACTSRGVAVANTPGVLTDATADLTWALLMSLARRIPEGHRLVTSGDWEGWKPLVLLGVELRGKVLGVVGMGRIGRAIAKRALGFGMEVIYHNRKRDEESDRNLGVTYCAELPELLRRADIITINAPLTIETHHLIGAEELEQMKSTSMLINTARGPLVDEEALVTALSNGKIWGAGLDVFEREPEVHPGLLELDNVVLAPHLGSSTQEARSAMARLCGEAVAAVLQGRTVPHIINPDVVSRTT